MNSSDYAGPFLVLVRGIPGSGKSTFAANLAAQRGMRHFENDMFFTKEDGSYLFVPELHLDAGRWCQDMTAKALAEGRDVVVACTFATKKELEPYLAMGHPTIIVEMDLGFSNTHDVPEFVVEAKRKSFEPADGAIIARDLVEAGRALEDVARMIDRAALPTQSR